MAKKEYIERKELIANLKKFAMEHYTPLIDMLIKKQPTADVVEVVRCKNCIYSRNSGSKWCCVRAAKNGVFFPASPSYFCASGKRKEQE